MSYRNINWSYDSSVKPDITTLKIVGHYSIDGNAQYKNDLSQLKYYRPVKNPVNFDLNANCTQIVHKSRENPMLHHLLRWLSENFDKIEKHKDPSKRWLEPEIICFRGILIKFLTVDTEVDSWIVCACKYRGTIYLCDIFTEERMQKIKTENKQTTAMGHKFEQYMLADGPAEVPDTSLPLNECEEFCCIFSSHFGNHSLLYGAEMDGIMSETKFEKEDTLIGKNIKFIELKTIPSNGVFYIKPEVGSKFKRLPKWWSQSYLVGVDKIVCGFKNYTIVEKVKEYSLDEIKELAKPQEKKCDSRRGRRYNPINSSTRTKDNRWRTEYSSSRSIHDDDSHTAHWKNTCNSILDLIKQEVCKDYNECIYRFDWCPSDRRRLKVTELEPTSEHKFLNDSYIDAAEEYIKKAKCDGDKSDTQV